jgi:hypothetical protein
MADTGQIERAGGIPAYGNSRSELDKGERLGFVQPNPAYRRPG